MKTNAPQISVCGLICFLCLCSLFAGSIAQAQIVEHNVNVTGTGAPGFNVGQLGRQENEPSCAINPLNVLNVMCAYNWYGFADLPDELGDSWIAFSETRNGKTFIRRPLTGTRQNSWNGQDFSADPTMLAWPGGAAVTSISGVRGGNSVMQIQRMMELNTETGFRHFSEAGQIVISSIQGSNFIDKPDARIIMDPDGGTTPVTMTLESGETVTREWPNLRIVVTFAVFNGSQENIRTFSTYSDGFGAPGTWSNPRQITQTSGLDQGLSVANIGDEILYTVRRFKSGTETDSIMGAISKNRGHRIGKVFKIADICAFDQVTLPDAAITVDAVSFRTNDFQWAGATGNEYILVFSERLRDAAGNCLFDQGTRIMAMTSRNGTTWSDPVEVSPVAGHAFQFMPTITCARGGCQALWYDTRNESLAFEAALAGVETRHWEENPFIEDFDVVDGALGFLRFRRTADVYTIRINFAANGDPLPSPLSERVSVYQIDFTPDGVPFEREFNPMNVRSYAGNTVPFDGDYIAIAAPEFRESEDGSKWVSNASAVGDAELDKVNYFAAWTDNRRIRGSILDSDFSMPTPYAVSTAAGMVQSDDAEDAAPAGTDPGGPAPLPRKDLLAVNADRFLSAYAPRAEGLEDRNLSPGSCVPVPDSLPDTTTLPFETRTKDSEIYGATVEDRVRLVSPTPAKNLGQIQRAFVLGVENIDPVDDRTFRLVIANQPGRPVLPGGDPVVLTDARASWRQLPFGPVFDPATDPAPIVEEFLTVPAKSTDYISLFIVSQSTNNPVTVLAYDDTDTIVAQITVNGDSEAGSLVDPGTVSNVLIEEIHNPGLLEPDWDGLIVNALNPSFRNPSFRNPSFRNPNFRNLDYQDPSLRNPSLRNPNFRNETKEATSLVNPSLRNPSLRNDPLVDSFVDVTFGVEGDNNTITATNADFAFAGELLQDLDTQLIAWEDNEIDSLQNCDVGLITENKVIAAVNNPSLRNLAIPDIDANLAASIRFPVAPGDVTELTLRIFGPQATLQALTDTSGGESMLQSGLGWVISSQAANTGETVLNPGIEQIIKDVIPPSINFPDGHVFVAEATGPGGADVGLATGDGIGGDPISADDDGTPTGISCSLTPAGNPPVPMDPTAPAPLGETGAQCVTDPDGAGNTGTWNGTVRVEDNTAPVINVPGGVGAVLVVAPASPAGANVDFLATGGFGGESITITEAISPGDVTITCTPASGSLFPIGDTPVSCTATDVGPCDPANAACVGGVNVSDPATFTVSVVDSDPPVINGDTPLPDFGPVEATALSTPVSLTEPVVDDTIDPDPVITNDAPAGGFPLGETIVTWTVTDFAGNTSTATQKVIVVDTTLPVISVPGDITQVTNSTSGASVNFDVTATDVFDVTVSCQANAAPVQSGDTFPVGSTTVQCTASDTSGNSAGDSFVITIEFEFVGTGVTSNKSTAKSGSSIPLNWGWTDEDGTLLSIAGGTQTLTVRQGFCPGGIIVAEDPGSSGIRLKSDLSWESNWQAVDQDGNNLPAARPSSPYCVTVTLTINARTHTQFGQMFLRP